MKGRRRPVTRATVKGPRFGDFSEIAIVVVFLAIVLYLSLSTSTFLSAPNIMAILVATSLIAVVACGQTFVIITGGIDLSSGSVVALSGVITGLVLHLGVPIWASIGVGILVGLACGLFNGLSITYLNMNPFIVTLAMMSMARGLAFIVTNGQTIFGFDDTFEFDRRRRVDNSWYRQGAGRWRHFLGGARYRRFRLEEDRVRQRGLFGRRKPRSGGDRGHSRPAHPNPRLYDLRRFGGPRRRHPDGPARLSRSRSPRRASS